MKLHLIH